MNSVGLSEDEVYTFKAGHEVREIPIKEIIYFEIFGRKVSLISVKGKHHFTGKIGAIEKELASFGFVSPHRSYVINFSFISSIRGNEIIMKNGDMVYLSRRKWKELRKLLQK